MSAFFRRRDRRSSDSIATSKSTPRVQTRTLCGPLPRTERNGFDFATHRAIGGAAAASIRRPRPARRGNRAWAWGGSGGAGAVHGHACRERSRHGPDHPWRQASFASRAVSGGSRHLIRVCLANLFPKIRALHLFALAAGHRRGGLPRSTPWPPCHDPYDSLKHWLSRGLINRAGSPISRPCDKDAKMMLDQPASGLGNMRTMRFFPMGR